MQNNIFIRIDDRQYTKKKEKIKSFFHSFFNKIKVEKIQNGLLVILPKKYCKNNIRLKNIKNQISKVIKQEKSKKILYAENVTSKVELEEIKSLYNGKQIMKFLIFEILDYIYDVMYVNQALDDIYVFVNEYSDENLYIINELINKFKIVNIITKNLTRYRAMEEVYENKSILITVSNNKKKSAKKAHMIINLDFEKSDFEYYHICNSSIIINLNFEKLIKITNFNGIIINDFNIILSKDRNVFVKEFYGDIKPQLFVESLIFDLGYEEAREFIIKENIKIENLIGVRGVISKTEILANKFNMYSIREIGEISRKKNLIK